MTAEDDALQTPDPFLGARCAVGLEVVGAVAGDDREVKALLVFIGDGRGDAVAQVDLAVGEVEIGGVAVV